MINQRYFRSLLFLTLAFGVFGSSGCGKNEDRSKEVELSLEPETPQVYPFKGKKGENEVAAPWVRFQIKLHNISDESVFIQAVSSDISIAGADGTLYSLNDVDLLPSTNNYSTDTLTCTYDDYGTYTAGSDTYLKTSANLSSTAGCSTITEQFYLGGLPKNDSITSYRYKITATVYGTFITSAGEFGERFIKSLTFYTQ